MSGLAVQVRQDAASLHRFVASISDKCEVLNGAVTYPESSERFFKYIGQLAAATKSYIQHSVDGPAASPKELLGLRDEIATLRASWGFMHQFVKPVLDADTLRLPICLLDGLRARFRQIPIPMFSNTDFIFYHSAQLNYFNVKLGEFKLRAYKISGMVKGPEFPKQLGLIGIPYSQSSSLFINCLIPHEMGHYLFGELQLAKKFRAEIESKLIHYYGSSLRTDDRGRLTDVMAFWVEELFCDLFAIRLVGLCFSLAFVELFDVATALDEHGACDKARAEMRFRVYPPDLIRIRSQVSLLKADGWWDKLRQKKNDSDYINVLTAADKLKDDDFLFPASNAVLTPGKVDDGVKTIFFDVQSMVLRELDSATGKIPNGSSQWERTGDLIERYLENGTVPSTLVPSDGAPPIFPEPIALLNSSYRFYIQSLSALAKRVEDSDPDLIAEAVRWAERTEMWAAKAIDDLSLPNSEADFPQPIARTSAEMQWREQFAVLSREEIIERLRLRVDNSKSLVITPLLGQEGFDQDSVDLRLGTHFLMPQVPPEPYMDLLGHQQGSQTYLHLHAPLGSYFVLPAHQTVLGATLEFVKLPYDVSGEILTKSSIARTFITIETAPWIHPSYRGCLTLEIANVSNTAIILYPGTPIGQLVLFHAGIAEAPDKLSGSYLGPVYPEAPAAKAPREALRRLKLPKYRRPALGWVNEARIRSEVAAAMMRLSPSEQANLKAVIKILFENGAFTSDTEIAAIF
jgi:dCTP deaminase